jgi:hypothetical protein
MIPNDNVAVHQPRPQRLELLSTFISDIISGRSRSVLGGAVIY